MKKLLVVAAVALAAAVSQAAAVTWTVNNIQPSPNSAAAAGWLIQLYSADPILGSYVDHKGKAASMLMLGSILLVICHLTFAFILPMFKGNAVGGIAIAYLTILVLGSSFSLVPASLWPSVPKLVDAKIIGSAYALIFWIQNIGLWLFPLLIGKVLDKTNPEVLEALETGKITAEEAATSYNYTAPLVMLACLGVAALILGFILKRVDRKKGYGLELPNIKG